MGKDIRQQLLQQEYGFPVDQDVADRLDADFVEQMAKDQTKHPHQRATPQAHQFTDENPFGL